MGLNQIRVCTEQFGDTGPGGVGSSGRLVYKCHLAQPKLYPTLLEQSWNLNTRTLQTIHVKPSKGKKWNPGQKKAVQVRRDRTRIQIACLPIYWLIWRPLAGVRCPTPPPSLSYTHTPGCAHLWALVQPLQNSLGPANSEPMSQGNCFFHSTVSAEKILRDFLLQVSQNEQIRSIRPASLGTYDV